MAFAQLASCSCGLTTKLAQGFVCLLLTHLEDNGASILISSPPKIGPTERVAQLTIAMETHSGTALGGCEGEGVP